MCIPTPTARARRPELPGVPGRVTVAPARRRDFRLLWAGQSVSQLGSRGFHIACLLWVVAMTGSPVQAGLAGSVMLGASTLVALPGGWLADRVDRRRLMMGCDVASGSATLSLATAAFADVYSLPHLLVVGVILGVGHPRHRRGRLGPRGRRRGRAAGRGGPHRGSQPRCRAGRSAARRRPVLARPGPAVPGGRALLPGRPDLHGVGPHAATPVGARGHRQPRELRADH